MKHPQEHTRRAICKLLREAGLTIVRWYASETDFEIAWTRAQGDGHTTSHITVRPDGAAEGTFPPELFAALCPDP
jgi:hypothetical protein